MVRTGLAMRLVLAAMVAVTLLMAGCQAGSGNASAPMAAAHPAPAKKVLTRLGCPALDAQLAKDEVSAFPIAADLDCTLQEVAARRCGGSRTDYPVEPARLTGPGHVQRSMAKAWIEENPSPVGTMAFIHCQDTVAWPASAYLGSGSLEVLAQEGCGPAIVGWGRGSNTDDLPGVDLEVGCDENVWATQPRLH